MSMTSAYRAIVNLLQSIPDSLIALPARIGPALVFWQSGQTKVEGWKVSENAIALFKEEYNLPLIDPTLAAYLATAAEHLLPILLIIGFASRFAALGLIAMTLVIQFLVYPGAYATHLTWIAPLLYVAARGPGNISLDHLIGRK
jgi:putative oxidoreductase